MKQGGLSLSLGGLVLPRTFVAAHPKETYLNEIERAKTTPYYVSIKTFRWCTTFCVKEGRGQQLEKSNLLPSHKATIFFCNIPNFGPNTYRHVSIAYDDYLDVLFYIGSKTPLHMNMMICFRYWA